MSVEPGPHSIEIADDDRGLAADRAWLLGCLGIENRGDRLVVVFADLESALHAARVLCDGAAPVEPVPAIWEPLRPTGAVDHRVGRFVVRTPRDMAVDDPTVLEIEAGGAFGSGSHVSTRLALGLVDSLVVPGAAVLDVGCGTGILGIAAARLGAEVSMVDIDAEARRVARSNAARCGVHRVDVVGSLDDIEGRFDLVVANLLINEHEGVAPAVRSLLGDGARVVASGLLESQLPRLVAAYEPLAVARSVVDEGWVGAVLA